MKHVLSQRDKEEIVAHLISTPEGKRKLAESLITRREQCGLCGELYGVCLSGGFMFHCDKVGDDAHLAASVMET